MNLKIIQDLVKHNVPRYIKFFHECGGVDLDEWEWLQHGFDSLWGMPRCDLYSPEVSKLLEDSSYPYGLLARADELLLYPKDAETFKNSIQVLVRAIAIMSFVPGGIPFAGVRFNSEVDGYIESTD